MNIVTLDLEGVLIPEIWVSVAQKTNIKALERTTRDEPDYDKLMKYRLNILNENKIKLSDIQDVIASLNPLDGAKDFVDWLRSKTELIILSDTFTEFSKPLMAKLGQPTLFCHELVTNKEGYISDYKIRFKDHKKQTVKMLKDLNYFVISSGDSFNDLSMLLEANSAALFKPTESFAKSQPQFEVLKNHQDLQNFIQKHF